MTNEDEGKSEMKGIYFEKGRLAGCSIILPEGQTKSFSIGSSEVDGPDILIDNSMYFYLVVGTGEFSGDYEVIFDFDGPIKDAYSGEIYDYGETVIRLL